MYQTTTIQETTPSFQAPLIFLWLSFQWQHILVEAVCLYVLGQTRSQSPTGLLKAVSLRSFCSSLSHKEKSYHGFWAWLAFSFVFIKLIIELSASNFDLIVQLIIKQNQQVLCQETRSHCPFLNLSSFPICMQEDRVKPKQRSLIQM